MAKIAVFVSGFIKEILGLKQTKLKNFLSYGND